MKVVYIMSIFVLLSVFLVSGAHAGCCLYEQYECVVFTNVGSVFVDRNSAYTYTNGSGNFAYDKTKKRSYVNATVTVQTTSAQPEKIQVVTIVDNGTRYTIVNNQCKKTVGVQIPDNCIPDSAQERAVGTVGNQNVDAVLYTYQHSGQNVIYEIFVARKQCIPIAESVISYSTTVITGGLSTTLTAGVTQGIKDPSIFDLPKSCLQEEMEVNYDPLVQGAFRFADEAWGKGFF